MSSKTKITATKEDGNVLSRGCTLGWYAMLRWSKFLQPQRGDTYQPRATPWVTDPHIPKP